MEGDTEKIQKQLDDIQKQINVISYESHFQTFVVILALLGIVTIHQLFKKIK